MFATPDPRVPSAATRLVSFAVTCRRWACLVFGTVVLVAVGGMVAWGFWTTTGDGESAAATGTLVAPTDAAAIAPSDSSTVTLSWTAASLATGEPAPGYYVVRIRDDDSVAFPACATSVSATTSTIGCDDEGVTDGEYHYVVTAVFGSWTATGAASNTVNVINDSSLPSVVASITPTPNSKGYVRSSPVTVTLSATAGFGVQSITYAVDDGSAVTVATDTASFTVSGDGTHTITFSAADDVGNQSATGTVLVRIDTSPPAAPSTPALAAASDSGSSSTDAVTKLTTPTLTGSAEDGTTVTLYDGATLVGQATASGGSYAINTSLLANGVHIITARDTDLAGNEGPSSDGLAITIDTVAPLAPSAPTLTAASDSGSSSTDRLTKVTTPTMTGTAEDLSTVSLYSGATLLGTGPASGGSYVVTSSVTLIAGTKIMTVKATDIAGNVSAASASTSVTIDITAPTKPGTPVLTAASDSGRSASDKNTRITTPTFTGTTTAATTLTLYEGANLVGSLYTPATSYSITSSTLADAAHIVTAKATDAAGNLSSASTSITVITDTVAPAAPSTPLLSAASDTGKSSTDRITKTTTPIITGTNESRAIVALFEGATQVGTVTTTSTTYSITSSTLVSGNHTLTTTATDIAGNSGVSSAGTTISIDTTVPAPPTTPLLATASDTGASSTDGITKTVIPTFTGSAESGATVGLLDGATATGTAVTATGGNYSALTSTLPSAVHTISARTTDVAGNVSAASPGVTITIDAVLPTVTINQSSDQADPTSSSPINFTVTFSESVTGLTSTAITYSGTVGTLITTLTGSGSTYNIADSGMTKTGTVIPALAAGKAQDLAGNLNAAATYTDHTVTYTDTTPPAAPSTPLLATASDSGSSTTDGITKVVTPTFTGTAEVGATVRLFDGATQVGSVVATAGTYSIASTTLTNGTHTMSATATDSSANASVASSGATVTIDTVLPTVTVNVASGQADPTSTSPINFTVTFSEPVTGLTSAGITYSGTVGTLITTLTGSGTTYNIADSGMTKTGTVIPGLAAGKAQDLAGNLNATATYTDHTVTYTDTAAPIVAISSFTAPDDGSHTAVIDGTAGIGPGDNATITVVLCTQNVYPCAAGNIKATISGVAVNATTGAWTTTSTSLGATPVLYARATQTDLTGNTGNSAAAGALAVP